MIRAETVQQLINLDKNTIVHALARKGHNVEEFKSAKFVGISNGNEFCYSVLFEHDGIEENSKVFVKYDTGSGELVADY